MIAQCSGEIVIAFDGRINWNHFRSTLLRHDLRLLPNLYLPPFLPHTDNENIGATNAHAQRPRKQWRHLFARTQAYRHKYTHVIVYSP